MPMPNRQIVNGEPYRYAYQGQEKDSETGKEAFQLRLWDGRIGRWLTTDPAGQYASPYLGMGNDPINMTDADGAVANPVYGKDGFRGYDSKGVGGEAIVYNGKFKEGMDQQKILDNGGKFKSQLSNLELWNFMKSGSRTHYELEKMKYPDQSELYNYGTESFEFINHSRKASGFGKLPASNTRVGVSSSSYFTGSASMSIIKNGEDTYLNVGASINHKAGITSFIAVVNVYDINNKMHSFRLIKKPFDQVTFSPAGLLGSTNIKLPNFSPLTGAELIITGSYNVAADQLFTEKIPLNLYK